MALRDDVAAINRLRYEYGFGVDTRDYELLRSVCGEWKMAAVTLTVSWRRGDESIMQPLQAKE